MRHRDDPPASSPGLLPPPTSLNVHADAQLPKEVPQDATYWYRRWLFACDMGDKAATDYISEATENVKLRRRLRELGEDVDYR